MDTAALQGKSRRRQWKETAHFRVTHFDGFDKTQMVYYLWDIAEALETGMDSGDGGPVRLNKEMRRRVRVEIRRYFVKCKHRNVKLAATVLMLALAMIGTFGLLVGIDRMSGSPMYPYLNHRNWVVYNHQLGSEVRRDEVVISERNGENLVKRVAGLPGDFVEISEAGDRVVVNGGEGDENYVTLVGSTKGENGNPMSQPMIVIDGQCLMLENNHGISIDSRDENIGTVSRESILGKVFLIIRMRGWARSYLQGEA